MGMPSGYATYLASMTATGKTLVPQSLIGCRTTVPCVPQRSTWKNQKRSQSEASFPVKDRYTLLSRQSPQIERESDQSTKKAVTNKVVLQ